MLRKLYSGVILSFLICALNLHSAVITHQKDYVVGNQPLSTFVDNDGNLHVFCNGIDQNFNGIVDDGDEPASWWIIDLNQESPEPEKLIDFPRYLKFPFRPAFEDNSAYIPFGAIVDENWNTIESATIAIYDLQSYTLIETINEEYNPSIVRKGDYLLHIGNKPDGTGFFKIENENSTAEQEIGLNLVDGYAFDYSEGSGNYIVLLLLENGTFGEDDSRLIIGKSSSLNSFDFEYQYLDAGFGANHLFFVDNRACITANKSHEFIILDPINNNEIKKIKLPTTGFDGPRESYHLDDSYFAVSSYSQNLFVVDINRAGGKELIEHHRTKGKNESLNIYGNILITSISNFNNYAANNLISIYNLENNPLDNRKINNILFTGYQPQDIMEFEGDYYVICGGIDFNFDGTIDENSGEQYPSLWKLNYNDTKTNIVDVELIENFEFPLNFPFRGNINVDGILYLPSSNIVFEYDLINREMFDSTVYDYYVSSATGILDYKIVGLRNGENNNIVKIANSVNNIDVEQEVGKNVGHLKVYQNMGGFGVIALCEGDFGSNNSTFHVLKLSFIGVTETLEFEVGGTGNHLLLYEDNRKVLITMNGSHEIHSFDLIDFEIIETYNTGTSGYAGPREAYEESGIIYYTTYSDFIGKIGLWDDLETLDGMTENINKSNNEFIISNIFYSNYEANNRILVTNNSIAPVVNEATVENHIRVHPLPAFNEISFASDKLQGYFEISISDINGNTILSDHFNMNGILTLQLNQKQFRAGTYFIEFVSGNKRFKSKFIKI